MVEEGADIIDIGGESTRPAAKPVDVKVELERVLPVLQILAARTDVPISIDTTKARVAQKALASGAEIVNDVSALNGDEKMAEIVQREKAAVILMHRRGTPRTMQRGNLVYADLMGEIADYLKKSVVKALSAGIEKKCLAVDPGIGFGKSARDNFRIIKNMAELKGLGMPIVIGTSRKSFLAEQTGLAPDQRIEGTAATAAAAIIHGCQIVRVHDVKAMKKVCAVADAIVHA